MGVEGDRELDGLAGVADPLEAAVERGVGAPAGHPRDVELAVLRVEPAAVDAREELAGQRDDRPLRLAVDLLAEEQEVRPRAEREVDPSGPRAGPKRSLGDEDLAAAGVVQPAREVDEREVGRPAVLRAAVAVVAAGADLADHRGGDPLALGAGDGDRRRRGEAEAVGVAEAGGQGLDRLAVGARSGSRPACPRRCRTGPAASRWRPQMKSWPAGEVA